MKRVSPRRTKTADVATDSNVPIRKGKRGGKVHGKAAKSRQDRRRRSHGIAERDAGGSLPIAGMVPDVSQPIISALPSPSPGMGPPKPPPAPAQDDTLDKSVSSMNKMLAGLKNHNKAKQSGTQARTAGAVDTGTWDTSDNGGDTGGTWDTGDGRGAAHGGRIVGRGAGPRKR